MSFPRLGFKPMAQNPSMGLIFKILMYFIPKWSFFTKDFIVLSFLSLNRQFFNICSHHILFAEHLITTDTFQTFSFIILDKSQRK